MWTPKPLLWPVASQQPTIDQVFLDSQRLLQELLEAARVHHVGSTALAPALCRGVIDIEVQLAGASEEDCDAARATIATCSALQEQALPLHITVDNSESISQKLRIRQLFAQDPYLLGEFIGLQKRFSHYVGKPYPQEKAAFYQTLLASPAYAATARAKADPYRVTIETERLQLVSALSFEAQAFAQCLTDNRQHLEYFGDTRSDEFYQVPIWSQRFAAEVCKRWCHSALTLLLYRKHDQKLIGACHFSGFVWGAFHSCKIGYQLAEDCQGQGYMSEACEAAIDYLVAEWNIHRIEAVYEKRNKRSGALAERLGFSVEGTAQESLYLNDKWRDMVIAALTR